MNNIKKFKLTIILIIFLIIVLGLLLYFRKDNVHEEIKYTHPGYDNEYLESTNKIALKESDSVQKSQAVGDLLKKIPFSGKNFSIKYDFDKTQFIAVINKKDKVSGDQEFDKFLKDNKVEDRKWITNLIIEYK